MRQSACKLVAEDGGNSGARLFSTSKRCCRDCITLSGTSDGCGRAEVGDGCAMSLKANTNNLELNFARRRAD